MNALIQRLANTSTPTEVLDPATRESVNVVGGWLELVLCLLMVLNSMLPVVAVLRYRRIRRHNMYVFLAGMAVSDVWVGMLTLASTALHQLAVPVAPAVCVLLAYLRLAANSASMLGLLALTADRCVAVLRPLRHRVYMSARRARRLAPLCWLVGALQAALLAAVFVRREWLPRRGVCDVFSALQPMVLVVMAFSTDLVVLVIVVLNVAVIYTALHHRRRLLADGRRPAKTGALRAVHLQSYAAVFKLMLLFLVLVVPFHVALHVFLFGASRNMALWVVVTGMMRQVYHIFNGWVFGLWCVELRRVYLHILCGRPLPGRETSGSRRTARRSAEPTSSSSDTGVRRGAAAARHSVDHGTPLAQPRPRDRPHGRPPTVRNTAV